MSTNDVTRDKKKAVNFDNSIDEIAVNVLSNPTH